MAADILDPALMHAAARLAAALGCGLLVGVERERRKGRGPARALLAVSAHSPETVFAALSAEPQPA